MKALPLKSPTLLDIARAAGLSKTTASYALRDSGRVSLKTRKKVQGIARKMGYVPNSVAALLASSKGSRLAKGLSIAFVTDFPVEDYNDRWFIPTRQRLRELGYEAKSFDLKHDGFSPVTLRNLLYHQGYSGIIFGEIRMEHSRLFEPDWSPFCVICSYRTYHYPPFDVVRHNTFEMITMAWNKIRERGYSRIGFLLCHHTPQMVDDLERQGALAILQQQLAKGETAVPPYLEGFNDGAAIRAWLDRYKPDAVVGFNNYHWTMLEEMGVRIPKDIGYVNLHHETNSNGLAAVDPGSHEIPSICADYIDQSIRHKRRGIPAHRREILAPVTWVPGKSLPLKK